MLVTLTLIAGTALAAGWKEAMATGDCRGVVAALPSPASDVERLAAARCLATLGEHSRAGELAGGVTDPALRPYAQLMRATAMLGRDNPGEAVAALDGVALPGLQEELLRGRALVEAGRSLEARDGLRALLSADDVGPEARFWLARGAEDRGDRDAAIETYRAVWTRTPRHPVSAKAEERLAKLGARVPDASTPEGRAVMLERARRLLAEREATEAIPLLDAIAPLDPFDSAEEQRFVAGALFDAKLYPRARDAYAAAPGTREAPETFFRYALATARAGDYAGAATLYGELGRAFPDSAQADEAAFKPGYMAHDAGEFAEAVRLLGEYLDARPKGKFASEARWFRAWDLHRQGKDIESANEMEKLLGAWPQVELAVAARYWRARFHDDRLGYEQVLSLYPDSSYAWFAAWRLGKRYPVPQAATAPSLPAAYRAAHPEVAVAEALIAAGMPDWARARLRGLSDTKGDRATSIALAWLLVEAEDYAGARKLACPWKDDRAALEACVVRPHASAVTSIAGQYGLNPLLPYAIMHAESGFNPSVTSPAGARGLMQLMPELAARLAAPSMPGFEPNELYRAGVNARLGTTELGLLSRRWERISVQPSLPLVIAGYNGGGEAVERWLGTYARPPEPDEFAENISYTETRRYVRRVLGYLQAYRRTYGDG
jgi:soluble lytic murein transglycosylase